MFAWKQYRISDCDSITWHTVHCEGSLLRILLRTANWIHCCDPVHPQGAIHFDPNGALSRATLHSMLLSSWLNVTISFPCRLSSSVLVDLKLRGWSPIGIRFSLNCMWIELCAVAIEANSVWRNFVIADLSVTAPISIAPATIAKTAMNDSTVSCADIIKKNVGFRTTRLCSSRWNQAGTNQCPCDLIPQQHLDSFLLLINFWFNWGLTANYFTHNTFCPLIESADDPRSQIPHYTVFWSSSNTVYGFTAFWELTGN